MGLRDEGAKGVEKPNETGEKEWDPSIQKGTRWGESMQHPHGEGHRPKEDKKQRDSIKKQIYQERIDQEFRLGDGLNIDIKTDFQGCSAERGKNSEEMRKKSGVKHRKTHNRRK